MDSSPDTTDHRGTYSIFMYVHGFVGVLCNIIASRDDIFYSLHCLAFLLWNFNVNTWKSSGIIIIDIETKKKSDRTKKKNWEKIQRKCIMDDDNRELPIFDVRVCFIEFNRCREDRQWWRRRRLSFNSPNNGKIQKFNQCILWRKKIVHHSFASFCSTQSFVKKIRQSKICAHDMTKIYMFTRCVTRAKYTTTTTIHLTKW